MRSPRLGQGVTQRGSWFEMPELAMSTRRGVCVDPDGHWDLETGRRHFKERKLVDALC